MAYNKYAKKTKAAFKKAAQRIKRKKRTTPNPRAAAARKKPKVTTKRMGYQNEEKTYCKEANGTARGYFKEAFGASQRKAHGYDA